MVALDTVKALSGSREATEDIAAADDDTDLHAHIVDVLDLLCILGQTLFVDTITLRANQAFAREFEKNAMEFCHSVL